MTSKSRLQTVCLSLFFPFETFIDRIEKICCRITKAKRDYNSLQLWRNCPFFFINFQTLPCLKINFVNPVCIYVLIVPGCPVLTCNICRSWWRRWWKQILLGGWPWQAGWTSPSLFTLCVLASTRVDLVSIVRFFQMSQIWIKQCIFTGWMQDRVTLVYSFVVIS